MPPPRRHYPDTPDGKLYDWQGPIKYEATEPVDIWAFELDLTGIAKWGELTVIGQERRYVREHWRLTISTEGYELVFYEYRHDCDCYYGPYRKPVHVGEIETSVQVTEREQWATRILTFKNFEGERRYYEIEDPNDPDTWDPRP